MINRYAARRIPIRSAVPAALFLCLLALASARAETLGVPSEPSQSTELRWKFTEGAELVYRMTMYNEMELPQGMGTSVTDLETTRRWEIIEIADNGPGLPERARAHLFEPFVGSRRAGGTGLGLPIAREIMRAHGGEISIARSDGDGTVIRLELPDQG